MNDLLAQFAIALNRHQSSPSRDRSIVRALLGIILLVGAAAAGAYGDVAIRRANEFFTPAGVPTAAGPASTAVVVGQTSAVPVATTREAPAPTISLEEGVARAVDQIRAGLPRKIDAITTVVGVRNEGTKIIYENKIAMGGAKIDEAKKRQNGPARYRKRV
jgi:hypothetical protein